MITCFCLVPRWFSSFNFFFKLWFFLQISAKGAVVGAPDTADCGQITSATISRNGFAGLPKTLRVSVITLQPCMYNTNSSLVTSVKGKILQTGPTHFSINSWGIKPITLPITNNLLKMAQSFLACTEPQSCISHGMGGQSAHMAICPCTHPVFWCGVVSGSTIVWTNKLIYKQAV